MNYRRCCILAMGFGVCVDMGVACMYSMNWMRVNDMF